MCIRDRADTNLEEIDLIGVTYGPGLVGALLIGIATAKAVAYAADIPIVGVHHIMNRDIEDYRPIGQEELVKAAIIVEIQMIVAVLSCLQQDIPLSLIHI